MTANIQDTAYDRLYNNTLLNLVFKLRPLAQNEIGDICQSEELAALAMFLRTPAVVQSLARQFDAPEEIVDRILDYDLNGWAVSMRARNMLGRVLTVRERVLHRLTVWQKNRQAMKRILDRLTVPRKNFLDVGCLLGLALANAAEFGFDRVVGVEILPYYAGFAANLKNALEAKFPVRMEYLVGDICSVSEIDTCFSMITCVDVFEHTPDLVRTIDRLKSLCADDGAIYAYQGNGRSLFFARNEPHYALPGLSILPRDLAIAVMTELGAVKDKTPYVVERWPTLEALTAMVESTGTHALSIIDDEINIRNDVRYPGKEAAAQLMELAQQSIKSLLLTKLPEVLRDGVITEVKSYMSAIVHDMDLLDDVQFRRRYLMDSWNIVIRPRSQQSRWDIPK